jgi:hypothetical protein
LKQLNPLSAKDRRITAFTKTFIVKRLQQNTVQAGIDSFDCWGKQQGGTHKFTTTLDYIQEHLGYKNFVTLSLMKRGCCPVITEELAQLAMESAD